LVRAKAGCGGADGIKTLLYYSPFSAANINREKQEWVKHIGEECAAADVAYFLEVVAYHDDIDEKSREFAALKPEIVTRGIEEFSKDQYRVDVLKVGAPVNMAFVGDKERGETNAIYTREEAKICFRRAAAAAGRPFIYLSEGVSNEVFSHALELAAEAGGRIFRCVVRTGHLERWCDGVSRRADLALWKNGSQMRA